VSAAKGKWGATCESEKSETAVTTVLFGAHLGATFPSWPSIQARPGCFEGPAFAGTMTTFAARPWERIDTLAVEGG